MKHHHDFAAERIAANHCDELMSRAAPRFNRAEAAAALSERMCEDLSERLRAHLIGARPVVTADAGASQTGDALMRSIGRSAANFSVQHSAHLPDMLVSFSLDDATQLTDRMFGGDGSALNGEQNALPLSTRLALQRIVGTVSASFLEALDREPSGISIKHDRDIARIAPFERGQYCFAWNISIAQGDLGPWKMVLAFLESGFDSLLQGSETKAAQSNDTAIFGEIPLQVSAVLAEMRIPLEKLTSLRPGDLLPFAPARKIPLLVSEAKLAEGQIGTLDDRMALQLTQIHSGRMNP